MSHGAEQGDQGGAPELGSGLEALQENPEFRGPAESLDDHEHANDHLALIYESREEQFASAIPFIRQGIERGEQCVYVADDNSEDEVLREMRARDIDVDAALESGALSVVTPGETYQRTGEFDKDAMVEFWEETLEEVKEEDYTGLRATAEMTWALDETEYDHLGEYEAILNPLYGNDDYTVLCQYNRERFPADVIDDVINTHPHLVNEGTVFQNFYYTPPEKFIGDADPDREVDRKMQTLRERTEAKAELQDHKQYLRELYEITAGNDLSFEETVEQLLELGCERFDLRGGALSNLPTRDSDFRAEVTVGPDIGDQEGLLPVQPTEGCFCQQAITWDEPTAVPDVVDVGWDDGPLCQEYGFATYFGMKVTAGTEPYGTLWFYDTSPRDEPFTEDEHTFLELMGQWISSELERTERGRAQRELYEIAADTDRDFDEKLQAMFDLGCERFDLELGGMARIDPESDRFVVESISGEHEYLEPGAEVELSETFCRVFADGQGTASITNPADAGFEGTKALEQFGVQSYLGTRLRLDDDLDRTFFFVSSEPRDRPFSDAERTFHHLMGQWVRYELDRRQREQQLEESKEHFERIFESSHDAIFIVNPDADEVVDANPAASEMLGFPVDELLSLGPSDLHADELDMFQEFVDDVFESGTGWTDELTCETKDRGKIPAEISAFRMEHEGRTVMLAAVRDISERKERERELEQAERQFEAVFNNPVSFVGLLGPDGTIRRINENALEFVGVDESEVRGEKFWDTPWFAHSEDVRMQIREGIARAADGEYVRAEIPHQSPDGETAIMDSMLEPVRDDDGEVVAIVPSGHDITELRERERSLRTLYEIIADTDRDFDEKLKAVFELGCDRFDIEYGGIAKVDIEADLFEPEVMSDEHDHLVPGKQYPLSETYCVEAANACGTAGITDPVDAGFEGKLCYDRFGVRAYFGTYLQPEGDADRTFYFLSNEERDEPFTDADHTFLHLMGQWVQYELERQHYERDLEETVDQLQKSNDRLAQFAYSASHDLQEPLRMVSSYLQLLENKYDDELDPEAREYIDFATDGADRMRAMIEDLLAFSRVEQGDETFEQVDCNEVVERTTADLAVQIEETDAEIEVESLPTVMADGEQLEQLFGNLVSNALKYTDDEPPHVEITAEDRGDYWAFSVTDDGIGIDPEKTDRIFEIFRRLHHEDEYPGTGIGLSLCQEIVENHGGEIDVESEPGDGSTFTFTLPKRVTE